ncbi:hypothetical protein GGTG_09295 [Gaeumannomyces tritici R3-111a-1]|uniref:Uncharacterized protein n=1 Tax=Gaeumannomyces tritici (strain R3-111a-1) TaxID=644352 RepID=J3P6Z8_GAET3|nr:hypothetical protein GGTG_09295 [Gaeumannomyces tritici R3-111a-1]EJT72429.1 hypothetical protein GGTG_09295 [Gaeumannomyces tritici R3-111a-1]
MAPSNEAIEERMARIATSHSNFCRSLRHNLAWLAATGLRIAAHCERPRPGIDLDDHAAELLERAQRVDVVTGREGMANHLVACNSVISPLWAPGENHAQRLRGSCLRLVWRAERAMDRYDEARAYRGELVCISREIAELMPVVRAMEVRLHAVCREVDRCVGLSRGFCIRRAGNGLGSYSTRLALLHDRAKAELELELPHQS